MRSYRIPRNLNAVLLTPFIVIGISDTCRAAAKPSAKTFIFFNSIRNLDRFRACCKIASQLKRYGSVEIDLGTLADKGWYQIPKGARSDWHEYGVDNATIAKCFPDPKIAPFGGLALFAQADTVRCEDTLFLGSWHHWIAPQKAQYYAGALGGSTRLPHFALQVNQ